MKETFITRLISKVKNLFLKLYDGLEDLYQEAESKSEAAVIVVSKFKAAVEDPKVDFFTSLTESDLDDRIVSKIREKLPLIMYKLGTAIGIIKENDSPAMAIYAVMDHLRLRHKDGRRGFWIELAAEVAGALLDGKLSFPELVGITQIVFRKLFPGK